MEEKCKINTDYACHIGGLKRCPIIENLFKCRVIWNTAMIPNFLTGRSWQTVQTQIPGQTAHLGCLIRGYTVCHTICIFWMHYSTVKPSCLNLRIIKPHFSGVRIFRVVTIFVDYCTKSRAFRHPKNCFIWAMTWQNMSSGDFDQARHKPACAATESS